MRARRFAAGLVGAALVASALPAAAQDPKTPPPGPSPSAAPVNPVSNGVVHTSTVELSLVVGENKVIQASDVASYSSPPNGVADVKLDPSKTRFVVTGLRPGASSFLVVKANGVEVNYALTVSAKGIDVVEKEVTELIAGYSGLRLRKVSNRFFVEGGVATEADARRVALIAGLYPGQVESLVVVGSVGADHSINIRIDFYFVQYDKTSSYGVGVSWPGRIGAGAKFNIAHDLVGNATSASATADQLLPALDLAQTRGWAKVLKHSTVITTSGSEATFTNGGEQNFQVATGLTSAIQAVKFGTNMTVLPRYDSAKGELEVKVNANVSDLTPPVGTTSIPGRQTSEIATFVHLKLGQSIVLSGIKTSSQTHSVTGLPGLSAIPVLGLLFGGHSNSVNDVEGAVFIIPSIVESVPRKAHNIVDIAMKQYEDYGGNIDPVESFPHAPPGYR